MSFDTSHLVKYFQERRKFLIVFLVWPANIWLGHKCSQVTKPVAHRKVWDTTVKSFIVLASKLMMPRPRNTNWTGMISNIDLLEITGLVKRIKYVAIL